MKPTPVEWDMECAKASQITCPIIWLKRGKSRAKKVVRGPSKASKRVRVRSGIPGKLRFVKRKLAILAERFPRVWREALLIRRVYTRDEALSFVCDIGEDDDEESQMYNMLVGLYALPLFEIPDPVEVFRFAPVDCNPYSLLFQEGTTQLGKEYSSNTMGDGPGRRGGNNVLVVREKVVQKKKKKPKPKKTRVLVVGGSTTSMAMPKVNAGKKNRPVGGASKWTQLIARPFDRAHWDAMIPDGCNEGAQAFHLRSCFRVSSGSTWDSSSSRGFTILPSLFTSIMTYDASTAGVTITNNGNDFYTVPVTCTSGSAQLLGVVSPANLTANNGSVRLAAVGVRLRSLQANSSAAASYAAYQVPVAGVCPPVNALATQTWTSSSGLVQALAGIAYPNNANLSNEDTVRFTNYTILTDVMEFTLKPTDLRASQWKPLGSASVGGSGQMFTGDIVGDYVVANATSGLVQTTANGTGVSDLYDMRGWPLLMLTLSGAAASLPLLDVELIYHFEMIPTVAAGYVGSSSGAVNHGGPSMLSSAIDYMSKVVDCQLIADTMLDGFRGVASRKLLQTVSNIQL